MKNLKLYLFLFIIGLFFFSCSHDAKEKEGEKKEVEVEALTICDVDVDILKEKWACSIDGDRESVSKKDVAILFKGDEKDTKVLVKTLKVKEIALIAENETKELELSTLETDVFKAWKRTIKVTRAKVEFQDKDVEVESLTICEASADIEEWNCLIKNKYENVGKNDIEIKFKGEEKNIKALLKNLQVKEISSIEEGKVAELELSTARTLTYKAWNKKIKVRRAWSNMDKNEVRFKKFDLFEKDYKDEVNARLEKGGMQLIISLDIDINSLTNKIFRKSSLDYEFYSTITDSVFIPSPKVDLQYREGNVLKDITDNETFDLATLVNENEAAEFHFSMSPKGQGNSWRMLTIKIRFCIKSDQAEVEAIKVLKSSIMWNNLANLQEDVELNSYAGNLQVIKGLEHDGTKEKPILLKGKFKSEVKVDKITSIFFKASPKAKVKYGKDKNALKDGELTGESYSLEFETHPIFIQIIAENGIVSKYYELIFVHNF